MRCASCGAMSTGGQFCVGCGEPLSQAMEPARAAVGTRERPRPVPGSWLSLQEIRLLACPKCGAPNSAARWRCARCGETFDEDAQRNGAPPDATAEDTAAVAPESARWLVGITVVAGLAVVAVAVLMLADRGLGPFQPREQPTIPVAEARRVGVDRVTPSMPNSGDRNVLSIVDDDPTTSWHVPGPGTDQWVTLHLDEAVQIDHLLIWNGDQRDEESFVASNRIKDVMIQFGNGPKGYTAVLPDQTDNVRVDVPKAPVSDVVKLSIQSVHGGGAATTALGEVEVLVVGAPAAE